MATSVDAKLLKSTKFPAEFNQKVDMQKVNVEVLKKWIAGRISDILGNEDDVVIELCFNLIEGARYPDIKKMQIQLTGFLDKDTAGFCKELWKLCLSAQSNPQGVPKELLEAKKLELIQEKIEAEKAADEARRRREEDQRRERELNSIRNRERGDRGRGGRGSDSWRGGWDDRSRDFDRGGRMGDRRGPRYSRSPPRRRDSRDRGSFRDAVPRADTYVPSGRRDYRRRSPSPQSASPSSGRSLSNSRSPPRRRNRSPSRSRSPPRRRRSRSPDRRGPYRDRGGRGRGRSPDRGTRRRSPTPSDISVSRSPRPSRRRRSSASLSPSPPRSRRSRRRDSTSRSRSRSRSTSRSLSRSPRRASRSRERAADDTAERPGSRRGQDRDERRLTRSNSRSITPHRRSRSPSGGRDRKRRRSLERYEPASKRRRNTSSVSSPAETRRRAADADARDDSDRGSPMRDVESSKDIEGRNEADSAL